MKIEVVVGVSGQKDPRVRLVSTIRSEAVVDKGGDHRRRGRSRTGQHSVSDVLQRLDKMSPPTVYPT